MKKLRILSLSTLGMATILILGPVATYAAQGTAVPSSWYNRCSTIKPVIITTGDYAVLPASLHPHSVYCWLDQDVNNYNEAAKYVQSALKRNGQPVDIDGYFGYNTARALMRFQQANDLKADGVYGIKTMRAMKWRDVKGRIGYYR